MVEINYLLASLAIPLVAHFQVNLCLKINLLAISDLKLCE